MYSEYILPLLFLCALLASKTSGRAPAFHLGIRDSFMVAHSFHGHPAFGPAGGLHGATYTCDVEFGSDSLHPECNWLIDIGKASELLALVLAKYNYQNLDELFPNGEMTTTEFLCRLIHNELCQHLKAKDVDFHGELSVKLWESHKAWASFSGIV